MALLNRKSKKEKKEIKSYLPNRFRTLYAVLFIMVAILICKVVYLQMLNSDTLIEKANDRSIRSYQVKFTRGKILDRNNRLLSVSDPRYSITLDPKSYFESILRRSSSQWKALAMEVGESESKIKANLNKFLEQNKKNPVYNARIILNPDSDHYWTLLSKMTGIDYNLLLTKVHNNPYSRFIITDKENAKIERRKFLNLANGLKEKYSTLMEKMYKYSRKRFMYVDTHRSEEIANYAKTLDIKTLRLKTEYKRVYPLAEASSQLLGFTKSVDTEKGLKGIDGLEKSFDALLTGKNGTRTIRKDLKGDVIETIAHQAPKDPEDLILSIDEELQLMAYKAIKRAVINNNANSGTVVLLDIQTGEVLAMASAPSFNPNDRAGYKPALARNIAIKDTFEPGSTVKPFVVLTALQNGVTYRDEIIDTRPFRVNGHTIRDVAPRNELSIEGILQKSSNVGVSRLALRMPAQVLVDTYSKVGFGKDTGLGLDEVKGRDGSRARWADIDRASVAYGYGLEVTPLQLARAYATLGSFGVYRPISITKVEPPIIGERVLPERTTREVVHMMESVAKKGGGGVKAAVDGYRVAIKTGTAKKTENGVYVDKYIAYTAGVAPASNPRFSLVVVINEPKAGKYYGGAISAPVFSEVMGNTLREYNVKPDNIQ